MSNIKVNNKLLSTVSFKGATILSSKGRTWDKFKDLASIVCSRESTYRTALDITGFDIPVLAADAFRGIKKFTESIVECLSATVLVGISPLLTTFVGKVLGKFILSKDLQANTINLLKFNMDELRDLQKFKKATKRIKLEEVEDKLFIASLFDRTNKANKGDYYKTEAKNIEKFCDDFNATDKTRKEAYKLKKATIIGESFLEGGFWGSYGLVLRLFRKHILKEERFTGTKGYVSDAESEQLGESGELNSFQKIIGIGSIFISPILNFFLLNKMEDREAVKKSKFLQTVDNNLDMTHGIYPKLGLLFTQTTVPKWIGTISLSQGWFERIERILKLFTVIPSWWLGHRITNGTCALNADKELSKKYKVKPGILVEPEYLNRTNNDSEPILERIQKRFPEPAKIHHVLKSTVENKQLQDEAEDLHAKCLYKGFALHSLLVFGLNMAVNYSTKLRALWALNK